VESGSWAVGERDGIGLGEERAEGYTGSEIRERVYRNRWEFCLTSSSARFRPFQELE
jgi:hypothetical protein